MMYKLVYSDVALNQLKKLDKNLRKRIVSALERTRIRPYAHVKRLIGVPCFSLRVGDYRIILNIKENALRIFVIEVGHRKKIYKKY